MIWETKEEEYRVTGGWGERRKSGEKMLTHKNRQVGSVKQSS